MDMATGADYIKKWTHRMYVYNPDVVHNENGGSDWSRIPDRRVAYQSAKYAHRLSATANRV